MTPSKPRRRWGVLVLALGLMGALAAAVAAFGSWQWGRTAERLIAQLEAMQQPPSPPRHEAAALADLPPVVQRFFRAALTEGQPLVSAVRVRHSGQMDLGDAEPQWRAFTSRQRVITRRPGFDWEARIAMAPGVPVHVHVRDAYVQGRGLLQVALWGLIPVADAADGAGLSQGELMRFLAEAAWYPTALLPSQGVRWQAVDDTHARATLTDGLWTVSLLFHFNAEGLIDTVRADARERISQGQTVVLPWEGRFSHYVQRDGMRIPLRGEVAWVLPEGPRVYWRGLIEDLAYDHAQ